MKTCKKLFSLLLVAVMLVAAIPTFAFAAAQNYELILKVDGTEVPGPRPTANFDKTTVATLDSNGELSTNAAADGFTVLNAFSVTGYSATGYNCTEVKFNDGAFKVRVELTTITCTHNWDYTDVGNDQQHLRRCTICNVKEMVDHNWVITNPEVAPTHTAEGSTAAKECSDCHKTIASTPIEKLKDHTFVNGVCACNAKEYKINYKLDGTDVSETYIDEAGNADMSSAKKVLTVLGKNADAYNTSDFNRDNVNISFTATTIPTNPAPASSYSKVVVVYCDENGNVKTNALLHCPGKGQHHADLRVLKLGPEDSRGIQQLQTGIHRDPLFASGDTGAIFCLGTLSAGNLVDEGGFSHIGNPHYHNPQGAIHALCSVPGQLLRTGRPGCGGKAGNAPLCFAVRGYDRHTLFFKIGFPTVGGRRVCQIHTVQDDHSGLIAANGINIRVPAGHGDPGVHDFANRVYLLQVCLDLPPGFGHMARIPLNIHILHFYCTVPILCIFLS